MMEERNCAALTNQPSLTRNRTGKKKTTTKTKQKTHPNNNKKSRPDALNNWVRSTSFTFQLKGSERLADSWPKPASLERKGAVCTGECDSNKKPERINKQYQIPLLRKEMCIRNTPPCTVFSMVQNDSCENVVFVF